MPVFLKDFVDEDLVRSLATRFHGVDAGFDPAGFVSDLWPEIESLELKDRMAAIARRLEAGLPDDYPAAVEIVASAAEAEPAPTGWEAWPLATFVELFGADDPVPSLDAMERITRFMSCEFAIRPLLVAHPDPVFARLEDWAHHPDEAVRRLVSEGTRPRLPWGKRVPALLEDPAPALALLERLRGDPSEVVRRSVANHLNDMSRDHPDLVVEITTRWAEATNPEMEALLKHALRTLVKRGDPGAMTVLGFAAAAEIEVEEFRCDPPAVHMGEQVEITARVRSTGDEAQRLVADLVIHFVKAGGTLGPKVFKWKNLELEPGETVVLRRRYRVHDMTTRTHHPGVHPVSLQVAGTVAAGTEFTLLP